MLMSINAKRLARHGAVAALLLGLGLSANPISHVAAQAETSTLQPVSFNMPAEAGSVEVQQVRAAAASFIRGMTEADAASVWMFASEEEHDAFGTETAAYDAYAADFPALTQAREVTFLSFREEGETPFVELIVTDASGNEYAASLGFWLDDAGDLKLISCDVKPAEDRVA